MQAHRRASRRFHDLQVGEAQQSAPHCVDPNQMIDFAQQFDPQWFHIDPEQAGRSPFGGVIASGIYTLALWRMLDHQMNGDIDYKCGVALEAVSFLRPVRATDTLVLTSRIAGLRETSGDDSGLVTMDYDLECLGFGSCLTLRAINLVYR